MKRSPRDPFRTRAVAPAAVLIAAVVALAARPTLGLGAEETPPAVRSAIQRGQEYLRKAVRTETKLGQAALATMALVKSGEPADSPLIKAMAGRLASSVKNYEFESGDQQFDNYVAAVVLMALTTIDANRYFDQIDAIAAHLMRKQNPNGSWDYQGRTDGDTSQSQYACLALWEANAAGVFIPIEVWDRALHWFITRQDRGGGFTYHPKSPPDDKPTNQTAITHSMSTAGAGSMILCRTQLPFLATDKRHIEHQLLIPVEESEGEYKPKVTKELAKGAIDNAQRWMSSNIKIGNPTGGHLYYYLYGLERYAALAELRRIGSTNWYAEGTEFLLSQQKQDGTWKEQYPEIVDTSFALLFLGRSTQKTIERIRVVHLGGGTLLGGRGIPSPDSSGVALRKKDRFKKIPKAPIEELLTLIETPNADVAAENTAVGLENVDPEQLVRQVGSDLGKLRRLARHADPGVRQTALTALSRTMDYTVVPVLIDGLSDSDAKVYRSARDGLRWISRRFAGFNLPETPPEPAKLQERVDRWRQWFASLKVEVPPQQEFDE